ncbi:MAG: STAS domain-containing protein [Limnohabitans sp.]
MDIEAHKHRHIQVLKPQIQALDASNSTVFKDMVRPRLASSEAILLNLEHVHFMDSSGLGALVWLLREVETQHGQVKLCCVTKPVQLLLEMVRMHRVFEIEPSVEQAVAGWAA